MKNLINRVQLIGNLGIDVESKELASGNKMAKSRIATHESYTKDGEKVETTYWHNLVAWGKTAERLADMCKKGSRLAVQGKLTNRSWEDQQGQKRYITEVVVDEFFLMSTKPEKVPF